MCPMGTAARRAHAGAEGCAGVPSYSEVDAAASRAATAAEHDGRDLARAARRGKTGRMSSLQRESSPERSGVAPCVLGVLVLTLGCDGMLAHSESQLGPAPQVSTALPEPTPSEGPSGPVFLRLRNESEIGFDIVLIAWTSDPTDFGPLPAGAEVEYLEVDRAYSVGYVRAIRSEGTWGYFVTDYVGESFLPRGYYTYVLRAGGRHDEPWEWDGTIFIGHVSIELVTEPAPSN